MTPSITPKNTGWPRVRATISYWKGNSDLLRAVTNICTQEAQRRLEAAGGCEDLDLVLEFAVDGDGHKEIVEKKKAELACPAP